MQRSIHWLFALTVLINIAGCGKSDDRLYGKWEGQLNMNWGNFGNENADAGIDDEQREMMEEMRANARERMAERKYVLEFTEDGNWKGKWGEDGGGGMVSIVNGEGTYTITEKNNDGVTLSLWQEFEGESKLKLKYNSDGKLEVVEYDKDDRVEFGKLSKQDAAATK